jgi:hypothetical protein
MRASEISFFIRCRCVNGVGESGLFFDILRDFPYFGIGETFTPPIVDHLK